MRVIAEAAFVDVPCMEVSWSAMYQAWVSTGIASHPPSQLTMSQEGGTSLRCCGQR